METDAPPLTTEVSTPRTGRRSRATSRSSSIGGLSGSGSGSIEYTSLRDVLVEGGEQRGGGSWREYSCHDIHDFDASNIGIRNQLLKHAASAYLQSAVVVPPRDQGCLARLWRHVQLRAGAGAGRGRGRVLMRACSWQGCVDDPAELCTSFVARSARRIAAFLADRVAGIWA
ncbi:hypothetical protein ABZP36_012805 [Zizania latifolia]